MQAQLKVSTKYLIKNNYLKEGMEPTGKLANFTWNFSYDNNLFQLQLMLPPEWKWVEYGRYPGPVNRKGIESIEQWIKIKGLVPQSRNGKVPSIKSLAFAIAKKFKKLVITLQEELLQFLHLAHQEENM